MGCAEDGLKHVLNVLCDTLILQYAGIFSLCIAPRVLHFSAFILCVCLSVCYHSSGGIVHFYAETKVRAALLWYYLGF